MNVTATGRGRRKLPLRGTETIRLGRFQCAEGVVFSRRLNSRALQGMVSEIALRKKETIKYPTQGRTASRSAEAWARLAYLGGYNIRRFACPWRSPSLQQKTFVLRISLGRDIEQRNCSLKRLTAPIFAYTRTPPMKRPDCGCLRSIRAKAFITAYNVKRRIQ